MAQSAVYFVDSSSTGDTTSCTGLCSDLYDGAGTGECCAFSHPSWALGAGSSPTNHSSGVMSSGDTLVIATGSYELGYGAMPSQTGCDAAYTYSCLLRPPPNGTAGNHTTVVGCTLTGCDEEDDRPELWLTGRQDKMMDLDNVQYVTFKDLEITDHHGSLVECSAGDPVENCGRRAFQADNEGWNNITFDGLNIHGLVKGCWKMGGDGAGSDDVNLVVIDTVCRAVGVSGFDADTCGNDGTCGFEGSLDFTRATLEYVGCIEVYPLTDINKNILDDSCRDNNCGGSFFGDAISSSDTGGDWTFTDCNISHNTSDGVDLLYLNNTDVEAYGLGSVAIYGGRFEGNVGQQVKISRNSKIYSAKIIGNCGYFDNVSSDMGASCLVSCRSSGYVIDTYMNGTGTPKIYNSTITSNGDITIRSKTPIEIYNSIIIGGAEYNNEFDNTDLYYDASGDDSGGISGDYNICYGDFKELEPTVCTAGNNQTINPQFTGTTLQGPSTGEGYYYGHNYANELNILSGSPAQNAADESAQTDYSDDYCNIARGASWDIGAVEVGSDCDGEDVTVSESGLRSVGGIIIGGVTLGGI